MPLVFVHGVANRRGTNASDQNAFDRRVGVRDGLFRTIAFADQVLAPSNLHIENPYWGDEASSFAWQLASVPKGGDQALGADPFGDLQSEEGRLAQVAVATTTGKAASKTQEANTVLLTLARQESLIYAVDAIIAAAAQVKPSGMASGASEAEISSFGALAIAYATENPHPAWLNAPAIKNDNALLDGLNTALATWTPTANATGVILDVPKIEALGISDIINRLKDAAQKLGKVAQDIFSNVTDTVGGVIGDVTEPLVLKARPAASNLVGRFVGDVFVYIQKRGTKEAPGPIVQTVIDAIDAAIAAKTATDDKLYIVAHSMGGEIIYDILTFYRPDIECDLLVTVGSQVAFFEELKLLQISDPAITASTAPNSLTKPDNVRHWLNTFDLTDIFGFTTKTIFDGVDNFEFDTETLPVLSHGVYFDRPRLYQRLRARIAEAFPPSPAGGGL